MERITEIQARLAEIQTELEAATGEALTALETESRSLLDGLNPANSSAPRSLQAQAPPCRHPLPFRYQLRKERQKNSQPPDV